MSSSSELGEHGQAAPTTSDRLRIAAVSFFGLGLAPIASGTFGTLGGIAIAVPLEYAPGLPYWLWLLVVSAVLTAVGVWLGNWAEVYYGKKDPGEVVLDEVVGYLVTVAVFDFFIARRLTFWSHVVAFLLFRAADVVKPPPGRRLERVGGGLGIMLDDIAVAFVYSGPLFAALGALGFTWL